MDKEIASFLIELVDDTERETRMKIVNALTNDDTTSYKREYAEKLVWKIEKCGRALAIIKSLVGDKEN